MEKIYQHILGKLVVDSGNLKPTVSFSDVTMAAARMGIERDNLQPLLCYLLENGCMVETPENPEDEQLLHLAKLSRYDSMLEKSLLLFFSKLKPSDESCISAMESITIHLAHLDKEVHEGLDYDVLQLKEEGFSAKKIAQMLEKTIEEINCAEKKVNDAIWKTRPQHHVHRKKIKDFYAADAYDEILSEIQTSGKGVRPVLVSEQVRVLAEQKGISETGIQGLVDYLVRHGCIVLSPDGELRIVPQEHRFRHFRTEESRIRYYTSCGEWMVRTIIVKNWYKSDAKDEKDALHKERFMKHLKRDDLLTGVYSGRERNLSTQQIAQELRKDPEEIAAADERIWNLYKASFPVQMS